MKKGLGVILTLVVILLIGIVGFGGYCVVKQDKKMGDIENKINSLASDSNDASAKKEENKTTNNSSKANSYDEANKAIKAALLDYEWLKRKDLVSYSFDEKEMNSRFMKIKDLDGMPAYIVCKSYGDACYERIVTYKDNKVYVSDAIGGEYTSPGVDVKNNIVMLENPARCSYYKIIECEFIKIDEFEDDGNMEENNKKYENYDFDFSSLITIELTEKNINSYVK